ncbi:MAG: Eco29kI family restriction endonuclease [Caulobacterales bacterium]|nr:Eco29kI family restriction endonuclease [Caulobacterales bacterium]
MNEPYNPLATLNLARSIEQEMLRQPRQPLSDLRQAKGAGVYAIYYGGSHPLYAPLASSLDSAVEKPIYVGKAIPKGGRVGGLTRDAMKGRPLGGRLSIHARSIDEAENLELSDFSARSLVVDDVWIPLGENMLIQQFQPVWNVVASGFGNQAPGRGRPDQAMSYWDTLHPGRKHSRLLGANPLPLAEIARRVVGHLAGEIVPLDTEELTDEDRVEPEN